jgi:hypothetical protein
MKATPRARICIVVVAVGLIALAAPVSSAFAAFTLNVSAPSPPVVGKPLVLQATGTIDLEELAFPYWFSLDAIPTSVTTTCPPDRWEGVQFAQANGGSVVVWTQREVPDAAGNFSIPIAVTPSAPGSLLLCAYTDDGATNTLARASLTLDIQPASSARPGAGRPSAPAEALGGVRSCRALLSGSGLRSCVRRAIRHANARCRRLPSPRKRASCLRAVRRVGKLS